MFKFLGAFIFLLGFQARAQFEFSMENFLSAQSSDPNESYANPGNRGGRVGGQGAVLEFRPEFKYKTTSTETVLRSRHFYEYSRIPLDAPTETVEVSKGFSDLTDAYIVGTLTDNLSATVGLQNYQWGPAEIASPSNVFFHFNTDQRSFFYKEKGRVIVRANWNYSSDVLFVFMDEPVDNNEAYWVAGHEFKNQSVIKAEKQFANPANTVSVLGGQSSQGGAYLGEHFNWSPVDGYSLYGDIRQQQSDSHHRPVVDNLGSVEITDRDSKKNSWNTYGVFGFRFEGDVDFRQEFIYNQSGYDGDSWDQVRKGLTQASPYLLKNFQNFAKPGLEFRSKFYGYSSIRKQDPFDFKDVSVAARWLYSLIQNSSVLQLAYEQNVSGSLVFSGETSIFMGADNTEFTLLQSYQLSAGLRYNF